MNVRFRFCSAAESDRHDTDILLGLRYINLIQNVLKYLVQKWRYGEPKLKNRWADLTMAILAPEAHIEKLNMIYIP